MERFDDDAFPLFSAQYGDRVDEWLNKVASVLQTVVHTDLTAPFALDGVNTFFWWYVAPLYEMGVVHNRIKSRGTPHTDREDVVEALEVVERVDWALPPQPASCARAASGRGHAWTAPAAHGGVAVAPKREYPRRGSNPRPAD